MIYRTPAGKVFSLYREFLKCPHLLIAGCTGSGKSVLINSIISTALYDSPHEYKFILLDPKTTELFQYEHLPHTIIYAYENDEMIKALRKTVEIMNNRLKKLHSEEKRFFEGPQILLIIDELADLMTTSKNDVVPLLQRICQIGRAAGIHCIAATQCLLSEVLPTKIKVNFSNIICLRTSNKRQSKFICDKDGAENFPDPIQEGKAMAYYRSGANIKLFEVYRVPESDQKNLINYWTSPNCIIK